MFFWIIKANPDLCLVIIVWSSCVAHPGSEDPSLSPPTLWYPCKLLRATISWLRRISRPGHTNMHKYELQNVTLGDVNNRKPRVETSYWDYNVS